jgi:hypothetical protein
MSRLSVGTAAVVLLALFVPGRAMAQPKHPFLHHAIYEMRQAQDELKKTPNVFEGHKEKALEALAAAITQTEKALESVGDPYKGFTPKKEIYADYKNFPHLRHSLVSLKEARTALANAKEDFGGHRDKAIKDIDVAIIQVKACLDLVK